MASAHVCGYSQEYPRMRKCISVYAPCVCAQAHVHGVGRLRYVYFCGFPAFCTFYHNFPGISPNNFRQICMCVYIYMYIRIIIYNIPSHNQLVICIISYYSYNASGRSRTSVVASTYYIIQITNIIILIATMSIIHVYVCAYIYIYIYMYYVYIHIYIYIYIHMYTYTSLSLSLYIYIYTYTYVYENTYTHRYA